MDSQQFQDVLSDQIERIQEILGAKGDEYASGKDKLQNFKSSAALQGITPREALMGYMAKHTVSVYEMGRAKRDYPLEKWDEKITDHINYLILLRALVIEADDEDRKLGVNGTN